jgi:putative ABC transport system permease protein
LDGLLSDLRHGLRMLFRTPLLSTVAVLTIGLGVGAVTFGSSVVYATMFKGPPVRDVDRLIVIEERSREDGDQVGVPVKDYHDLRAALTSFEVLSGFYMGTVNVAADDGPPERYSGGFMSARALEMTGVAPLMGRTFREGEDVFGAPALVVLGYNPWRTRFAADPDILGKTVRVNGETAEVIGVMPEGFRFPFEQDVWVPYRVDTSTLERRGGVALQVMGYLRTGVSMEAAAAEVEAAGLRIAEQFPEEYKDITMELKSFMGSAIPPEIALMMGIVMAMVVGVLLVACANVANVLLARSLVREREVAVRSALGADRSRVVRQLLIEAVVVGLVGGVVGTAIAHGSLILFERSLGDLQRPYWIVFQLSAPVLALTTLVTLLASVGAGIWPALRASGGDTGTILRDESRGSSSLRTGRFTHSLVVGELAVSCGLMIAAGLMINTLFRLNDLDLGFDPEPVMTARIGLFESDHPDADARSRFYHELLDRVAAEPGVESAALAQQLPATGSQGRAPFEVEGERYDDPQALPRTGLTAGSTGYFETFGIRLAEGRGFERSESERGGEPVAVVSRAFVEQHLGGGSALGRRIRVGGPQNEERAWLRIVGVAENAHPGIQAFGGGGETQYDVVYQPLAQQDLRFMSIAVRAASAPGEAVAGIRRAVTAQDPNLPIYFVFTLPEAIRRTQSFHRIFGSMFVIFGVSALFLAAVGLYGVMDFSVSSRTREMGVRTALGASRARVFRLVLGRVAWQLAIGATLGVGLGVALAIPLASTFYGIQAWNGLVYGGIVLLLVITGFAATLAPAWRAVRVDPVVALRA